MDTTYIVCDMDLITMITYILSCTYFMSVEMARLIQSPPKFVMK